VPTPPDRPAPTRRPLSRELRVILILGVLSLGSLLAAFLMERSRRVPDRVESIGGGGIADGVGSSRGAGDPDRREPSGGFEIVTHTLRYTTGWNEGDIRTATTENYSLRYRGKPFTFEGRAGMFGDTTAVYETLNAVLTFPTTEPAFVVNVGDPNNTSFFYLIREANGKPVAEYLAESSGGVSADWLDPPAGGSTAARDIAVHRARLEGGRWLLLGQFCVLDVQTLKAYAFEPQPGTSLNEFKSAIAMSPDRKSFVRFGYGESPGNVPLLVVFDFVAGSSYTLPIRRTLMRYNDWEEIDAAWLDHYFEWRRADGADDQLVQRADAKPLPYHGSLSVDPNDGYHEYDLVPARVALRDTLVAFLQRELGGERLPSAPDASADSLRIGGRVVYVMFTDGKVAVWMSRDVDSRLVAEIAQRFDAALQSGVYDDLFSPSDSAN
jgi:hypothetical protein